MTTTFFLVRHAAHDNVGAFLAGREVDVRLGEAGLAQAKRLAIKMSRERTDAIHSSPRRRTRETAAAISAELGVEDRVAPDLDEIDFGKEWCGRDFGELDRDPRWRQWNAERATARTPAGETLGDVQKRIVGLIECIRAESRGGSHVLVSHADVIKVAITHYLGLGLEFIDRFEISPASISTLVANDWGARLVTLNDLPE